jgi:hypothetical protein
MEKNSPLLPDKSLFLRDTSRFLPETYQPSAVDVICGRGKSSFYHSGNTTFRACIAQNLDRYTAASNKLSKSMIVSDIAHHFLLDGERPSSKFVRYCDTAKRYYEIPYDMVREKVGQTLRDAVIQQDHRRLSQKKRRRALRNAITSRTTTIAHYSAYPSTGKHSIERSQQRDHVSTSLTDAAVIQFRTTTNQTEDHDLCGPMSCSVNAGSNMQLTLWDLQSDAGRLRPDFVFKNEAWWASPIVHAHKTLDETLLSADDCSLSNEEDSGLASVSSGEWFRDCRDMSIGKCDWFDDDESWNA